jgi:hypothetical protein
VISEGLGNDYDYQVSVHQMGTSSGDECRVYCVVHIPAEGDDPLIGRIQRDALRIKRRLAKQQGVEVRLFLGRKVENDLRTSLLGNDWGRQPTGERRGVRSTLICSMERGQRMVHNEGAGFGIQPAARVWVI